MRLATLLFALAACETEEIKRLGALRADLDRALADRERCAAEPACLSAPRQLDVMQAELERELPRVPPADAFRQALATRAAARGLTLELTLGIDRDCTTPIVMTVLGSDDDAEAATRIALELPRVVVFDRAMRLTGSRRGWTIALTVPRECRPPPQPPPEPAGADANAIAHSRWSSRRAQELRESIAARAVRLAQWSKRTPYPAAVRARREALLGWHGDVDGRRQLRALGLLAAPLLRSRLAAIDRITLAGDVVVEGGGRLVDPRVAFGDVWTAALEPAPAGRFRVRLIRKGVSAGR